MRSKLFTSDTKRLSIFVLLVMTVCSSLFAQVSIEQYFPQLHKFQFNSREIISDTIQDQNIGAFNSEVLNDYILLSHSKWSVRSLHAPIAAPYELEVYEMHDAAGAYGIFSLWGDHLQGPWERLSLSVDNYYSNQTLSFWRGNYFFQLTTRQLSKQMKDIFYELANAFVRVIPLANLHPVTVVHLPQDNLITESIRFYLGKSSFSLNHLFPDHLKSAIGFSEEVEIAYAHYDPDGNSLFLMGYPTIALAAHQFAQLQNSMHSYFSPKGVYMKRVGVMVAIFFGPEQQAHEILAKVHYAPRIKWIFNKEAEALRRQHQEKVLSLLGVVTKSMLLALFFIVITLGTGVGVGFIRYQLSWRYPEIERKNKMIELELR